MCTNKTEVSRSWLDDLLIILVLLVSTRAAFVNFESEATILIFLVSGIIWLFRGARIVPAALIFVTVSLVWLSLHAILHDMTNAKTLAGHFVRILIAFFVLGIVARPLDVFVKWVTVFSSVGLGLFFIGLLAPTLTEVLYDATPAVLQFSGGTVVGEQLTGAWARASWLFYIFAPERSTQNHGFMWEPAAYAMVCSFALWCRILAGRYQFDRTNIILLLAIASTVSTTGTVGLAISLGVMLLHRGVTGALVILLTLPMALAFFFNADFLVAKILAEVTSGYSVYMQWGLSRSASFQLDMQSLRHALILGNGIVVEASDTLLFRLPSNNGFSDYLARHGLVMSAYLAGIFMLGTYKQFRVGLLKVLCFCAVVFLFAWSEKFFELPLFYLLAFAGYYRREHAVSPHTSGLHLIS
ncbi:hypothetical protein [Parasedimentitalea denitrificans]|uniref:hypothetical protein n=1 Tax=Parasedimentitalea denitrificans TaxID=2211118 RepID=UPI001981846B|nr:hypothetical protein [Sedimentitalea sp. CY04]